MASWRWCVVALALSLVSVLGKDILPSTETTKAEVPAHPTLSPDSTPITSPQTTPSPEPPKTTTPPPSPSPEPPKTTTPAPSPSPAPPTPILPPTTGLWNYTDTSTNITCIVIQFAVQFNVSYAAGKETLNATFNLPNDSLPTAGNCGNTSQWITLSWPKENSLDKQSNFTVQYELNTTTQKYYVRKVSVALLYDANIFPNATSKQNMAFHNEGEEWTTGVKYSYRCKVPQSLKLTSEVESTSGNSAAEVTVLDLQEEAFRSVQGRQFGVAVDCEPADVPDVVPIAVGCALGALVLVVLAAYLVGRRRSLARGYLSM